MGDHPPVELPGESRLTMAWNAMAWNAWGTPADARPLSAETRAVLEAVLKISTENTAESVDRSVTTVTRSRLTEARLRELAAIVGDEHVSVADDVRMYFLGGKSTPDLLTRRHGGEQDAPDAVVFPADESQVEAVLRLCAARSIAVVPFGGGTSVVGGVDPVRGWFDEVVSISMRRMCAMTELDEFSRTATFQAGTTGPDAEAMLARHGLSLGHFPQSFQFATIGGFAATRSSGQASGGYGRFDDMVEALTIVTPIGTTTIGRAPASAAGPDLRHVFLGSEGTLGIITAVTVRVHPIPESTEYRAWWFPDFASGVAAFRDLAASRTRPTVMRLSDEAETGIDAMLSSLPKVDTPNGGCVAIATFEGDASDAPEWAARADATVERSGGSMVDAELSRRWERGRFDSPYLRDALLDCGALAETLETATSWSRLAAVRRDVTSALVEALTEAGTPPVVMCHVSHVYATGASLYFTVVCAAADDPIAQWRAAKAAATASMSAAGATVTHHHAVGRDHRQWMNDEVGVVGTALLRAMKYAVDPAGVLNPDKLIP